MEELTNNGMIEAMYADLQFYKKSRVGRKHLTDYEMWKEWIEG